LAFLSHQQPYYSILFGFRQIKKAEAQDLSHPRIPQIQKEKITAVEELLKHKTPRFS
jgi:hypothetical protein